MDKNTKNMAVSAYENEYVPFIIKFGRATNLIGAVFAFIPCLALYFVFDLRPAWAVIMAGFLMQASVSAVTWFTEPISYFPVLGLSGTYMAFLTGNVGNLRLPASVAALTAANVEPGSEKGNVISTVGIAVSVLVSVIMLTAGAVLGASVLSQLPAGVITALNNILPALFGAILAQQVVAKPKIGLIGIALTGIMFVLFKLGLLAFLPGTPTYAVVIVGVFGTILLGRMVTEKELAAKGEKK